AMGVLNALGWKTGTPVLQLWRKFFGMLNSRGTPTAAGDGIPGRPLVQGEGVRIGLIGPAASAAPADGPGDRDPAGGRLWARSIERLLSERDLAEARAREDSLSGADGYWAAMLLASAASQVRLRVSARGKSSTRKKTRIIMTPPR